MQSLSYWKQFESTGKIEDYLSYSSVIPGEAGGSLFVTVGQESAERKDFRECAEKSCEESRAQDSWE